MDTTRAYTQSEKRLLTIFTVATSILAAAVTALILVLGGTGLAFNRSAGAAARQVVTTNLKMDILPVKPGGPAEDWPAYMPATSMTVPANTKITVTIRNFDLGDAALPAGSPLAKVTGTVGGSASFDGRPYTSLDVAKVAHTFTVPQLGINVPIPGDAPDGSSYLTVTFSFQIGKAGHYTFECYAPCGTGTMGWNGPMASMSYMRGTLTAVA
jgi:hypothetical protein